MQDIEKKLLLWSAICQLDLDFFPLNVQQAKQRMFFTD